MSNRPWIAKDVYYDCQSCDMDGRIWVKSLHGNRHKVTCQRCGGDGKLFSNQENEQMTNDEWLEDMEHRLQKLEGEQNG